MDEKALARAIASELAEQIGTTAQSRHIVSTSERRPQEPVHINGLARQWAEGDWHERGAIVCCDGGTW
jgi:hypothetical protein